MSDKFKEWMLECEAKEWITRYKKRALEYGASEARDWWTLTIQDIEKRRGKPAADQLRKAMNEVRSKGR